MFYQFSLHILFIKIFWVLIELFFMYFMTSNIDLINNLSNDESFIKVIFEVDLSFLRNHRINHS